MNKTGIKNYAIWARNKLIADITYKAGLLGITEKEIKNPLPKSTKDVQFFDIGTIDPYSIAGVEIEQRRKLAELIQQKARQSDYKTAYKSVIEEVAYTWFNRLIAIRFMEVNDYLPSRVRVLSSESSNKIEPDLVTSPFDAGLDYSPYEKDRIIQLKNDNLLDELFRMLFIKQCNALNAILPELFEKTNDYTELLMNVSFTDKDGVVYRLVQDIPEEDFNVKKEGQVEIIGWLYQYYNTEPKQEVFDGLKKNIKITREKIPAATQLFTPHWIVCYMVENSLGRLWLESSRAKAGLSDENLNASHFGWKYYIEEAQQEPEVEAKLKEIRAKNIINSPEDITFIDPCMGSGHILIYAFEVLMQIYASEGYAPRDAAKLILEKNLYGLDIDKRAYQLAYFSLMMKGRSYNRRLLNEGIRPQVYHPEGYPEGEEYGSLIKVDTLPAKPQKPEKIELFTEDYGTALNTWNFKRLLHQKYDVVVTNPPYMGGSGMNARMSEFVRDNYPDSKSDLFAVFIEKCGELLKPTGYQGMITQHSWMFLSSYEKLRSRLSHRDIVNMAHLGPKAFEEIGGEVVQTTAFVMSHRKTEGYKGAYARLVDYGSQNEKEVAFLAKVNRYTANAENFAKIPGSPVAYWVSDRVFNSFNKNNIKSKMISREGMATADNDRFLRFWFEVDHSGIGFSFSNEKEFIESTLKWVPYCKGGNYRKWYGNNDYVVNWENGGHEIRNNIDLKTGRIRSHNYNGVYGFRKGLTWTALSSGTISIRYSEEGFLFDSKGAKGFPILNDNLNKLISLLNSKVSMLYLGFFSPTLDFKVGDIVLIPYSGEIENHIQIDYVARENIEICKQDWDSFETSWDFLEHPLINDTDSIKEAFENWQQFTETQFTQLKANEEELNRIFIEIYGLQDELTPEVDDKDVTIARVYDTKEDIPESMKGNNYVLTKSDVIKSLVSYAVGCMFGRYSLDAEGLAYAGGEWDDSKYATFIPDKDNIIPITDEEYFEDDVVGLFCAFLKKAYGEETLEENLDFIAEALGNRGDNSREVIRNYFLKDFFKDHCKTYQKRPIYWLFDGGKADGFKVLVYMHRYDADTIGRLRIDYLHRMQRIYENEIDRMQEIIDNSTDGREVTAATKRKEKLIKQLKETKEYDEKIAHLALARIEIDLDDGVKVNYEKVQTDTDGNKLEVLARI
jgi:type II restriction/modification system DNA methylase subunit YeeA